MKKLLTSIAILITLLVSTSKAEYFKDVIITSPAGIWTDSRAYSTLQDAVDAIGSNEQTLIIASNNSVSNLTIPSNINLEFVKNGKITYSGQLTINTLSISAPPGKVIFSPTGSGEADFAHGTNLNSSWFNNLDDMFRQVQDNYVTCIINSGWSAGISTNATVGDNVTLKFEGPGHRIIATAGTNLSNVGNIVAENYEIFAGSGDFDFKTGEILRLNWFNDLQTFLGYVESEEVTLQVNNTTNIDTDQTVPSNVILKVENGGLLNVASGKTLTINGEIEAPLRVQIFSGSGSVKWNTPRTVTPHWFNSADTWDGVADAVDSLSNSYGGTILFPCGIYDADTAITISSWRPINLIGEKYSGLRKPNTDDGGTPYARVYIRPTAALDYIIKYDLAPDETDPWKHGSGVINGLTFLDDSNHTATEPIDRRTHNVGAALYLRAFDYGLIEDCAFHYIKGTAIKTQRMVKADVNRCVVEFCGDTGKPAIDIAGTSANDVTQAVVFSNCKIESNLSDSYVKINEYAMSITFSNCDWESYNGWPNTETASQQHYVESTGEKIKIIGCHANKCDEIYFHIQGLQCQIIGLDVGGDNVNGVILWEGGRGTISGISAFCGAADNDWFMRITSSAANTSISNCTIQRHGGILCEADYVTINGVSVHKPETVAGGAVFKLSGTRIILSGCLVYETENANVDGVYVDGHYNQIIGNSFCSTTGYGVNTQATYNMVCNNEFSGITDPISIYSDTVIVNDNRGYVTEGSGATQVLAGNTSATVTHGLDYTPDYKEISFAPTGGPSSPSAKGISTWYISNVTATTFDINVDAAPSSNQAFMWQIRRARANW